MSARVLAAVWVPGVPRTQGSMTPTGGGRMKHSDALVAWRSMVRDELSRAARLAEVSPSLRTGGSGAYIGPVAVRCIFVRGDGVGDIDKLARAVLDALTDSRVIADDVQVVKLVCDRVERAGARRGDGAFVLVATVDDGAASPNIEESCAREIDGWVPR